MKNTILFRKNLGFTLVEMAVVLIIAAILLGGLLVPIAAQQEIKNLEATRTSLKTINEALLGFAVLNGRLPCPSTQADPTNANYGLEDAACSASYAAEGYLPWRTLGVAETDEWGTRRTATTSNWNGYWRYRIDRNYTTTMGFSANILAATATYGDTLSVRDSGGNTITSTIERPVAIVYSTGKNFTADGQNASFEATTGIYESNPNAATFDDIPIWVTRPTLVNRLVAAGKLP
jgi:prepilin-type N-terminal cleavage/methylation domain-containing protein